MIDHIRGDARPEHVSRARITHCSDRDHTGADLRGVFKYSLSDLTCNHDGIFVVTDAKFPAVC